MHQQRNDGREGVFREQLLPSQDDDDKAEGVPEFRQQRCPHGIRQMGADETFGHERKAHRQAGRKSRPCQCGRRPVQFRFAFFSDRLMNDDRADGGPSLDLRFFGLTQVGGNVFRLCHGASILGHPGQASNQAKPRRFMGNPYCPSGRRSAILTLPARSSLLYRTGVWTLSKSSN